mmetsp:Transcript_136477/g.193036  ORF Transcript_136477/g.193036 Transcript_136477/m.193036 type:complete len:114 (-) Transcript_136477:30-371(-)
MLVPQKPSEPRQHPQAPRRFVTLEQLKKFTAGAEHKNANADASASLENSWDSTETDKLTRTVTFAPALEILTYSVAVDEYEDEEEPHWKAAVRRARQRRADREAARHAAMMKC